MKEIKITPTFSDIKLDIITALFNLFSEEINVYDSDTSHPKTQEMLRLFGKIYESLKYETFMEKYSTPIEQLVLLSGVVNVDTMIISLFDLMSDSLNEKIEIEISFENKYKPQYIEHALQVLIEKKLVHICEKL